MSVFCSAKAGCETCERIVVCPNCVTITQPQIFKRLAYFKLRRWGFCCKWLLNAEIQEGDVMQHIGVGEGKFFEVRRILAGISPNLSEKILGHFLCEHFLKQVFFWNDLLKEVFMWFCQRWAPFLSRFSGILQRFSQILPRFTQILPEFSRILPGFSTYRKVCGALAPPASYTSDAAIQWLLMGVSNIVLYCVKETRGKM